jgi:hypothetical protein
VVVLGKKWSCLEKSGHFLEKSGIDVHQRTTSYVNIRHRIRC